MPTLLDHFNKKEPCYPTRFRDMIDKLSRKRAFDTSVGTEEWFIFFAKFVKIAYPW